jgi:peptide-methionine (R)-S-oxide reductase
MRRRCFLLGGGGALALMGFAPRALAAPSDVVSRTEDEWRALLSPEQYAVLRQQQTEQPYSSPLTSETRRGAYACGGCDLKVFSSSDKYDSRTGWPSFRSPLARAVLEKQDRSQGLNRTKVQCRRCGCHLGHVFGDGPPPARLRYCINGAGLKFIAA